MEKMNDLRDLLKHEIQDLYSAEEQIIKAMPAMIDKARHPELKKALKDHLRITEQQKKRLDQVRQRLESPQEMADTNEDKGLFSRLMARRQVCKGMEGILKEGDHIMSEDMNPDVLDAAIIASAQKVEHYEICGYGTAKAYARELNLTEVESLLDQTLQEEYQADDLLTQLAVGRVNREAESGSKGRTAAAGQSGTTARSEGGRATSRERARINEPEMEMARGSRTTGASARPQGAAGSTGGRTAASTGRTSTPGTSGTGRSDASSRITSSRSTSGTSKGSTRSASRTSGSTGSKGTSTRGGSTRTR